MDLGQLLVTVGAWIVRGLAVGRARLPDNRQHDSKGDSQMIFGQAGLQTPSERSGKPDVRSQAGTYSESQRGSQGPSRAVSWRWAFRATLADEMFRRLEPKIDRALIGIWRFFRGPK